MIMDHKDLLNDVVKNMATTNEEEVVGGQMNGGSDAIDAGIPLYLSIGETYMMDAQVYDWEKSVELLPQMETNMMGIRGIMRSLVDSAYGRKPENDDDTTLAQRAISEFTNFFKQYQIDIDYKKYFEGKPDTEESGDIAIAMLMGFDAMNIIATIKEHTVTYQTIKVLQNAYSSLDEIMHDNEELNAEMEDDALLNQMASVGNFDKEETDADVELNTYNVVGLYVLDHKEDGSEVMVFDKVVSIEETAYIAADEQYLLEYGEFDTDNMIATASGTIMAHDLDEAREVAAEFFVSNEADIPVPGHENDMAIEETFDEDKTMTQEDLLRTFGFDSHDVSGLIDN
jgi:hypothetical protein